MIEAMVHYPDARRYLREELSRERGRTYSAILTAMAGLSLRSEALGPTRMKTLRSEANGMQRALILLLRIENDMSEADAERLVKADEARWREAEAEDRSAIESAL